MSETLTVGDVARLMHHPEPESRAAGELVRRLVRQGMPAVTLVRPMVFLSDQVIEWLKARASPTTSRAPKKPARKRTVATSADGGPIARRLAELRAGT